MNDLNTDDPAPRKIWATANIYTTATGEKVTIRDLVESTKLSRSVLLKRLNAGMTVEEAIKPIPRKTVRDDAKRYLYNGAERTVKEIAALTGIKAETLYRRVSRWKNIDKAVFGANKSTAPKTVNAAFVSPTPTAKKPPTLIDFDDVDIDETWIEQSSDEKKALMRAKKQREYDFFERAVFKQLAGVECYENGR